MESRADACLNFTIKRYPSQCTLFVIQNLKDIQMYFRDAEYVLVIVKAELTIKWKTNGQVEEYRFYYPYQELIVNPFIKEPETKPTEDKPEESSLIVELLIAILIVVMLAAIFIIGLKFYKKYYRVPDTLIEE
jgi:hypothetical protein